MMLHFPVTGYANVKDAFSVNTVNLKTAFVLFDLSNMIRKQHGDQTKQNNLKRARPPPLQRAVRADNRKFNFSSSESAVARGQKKKLLCTATASAVSPGHHDTG